VVTKLSLDINYYFSCELRIKERSHCYRAKFWTWLRYCRSNPLRGR